MTNTEEEKFRSIVNGAVQKAFSTELQLNITNVVERVVNEHLMFFTQTAINHGNRIGALEGRASNTSLRVKAHQSMLDKLAAPRALLFYHAATIGAVIASHFAK